MTSRPGLIVASISAWTDSLRARVPALEALKSLGEYWPRRRTRPVVDSDSATRTRPLASLTDYELRNLARHLASAGLVDALHRLLAMADGPTNAMWAETEARAQTQSYIDAVVLARDLVIDQGRNEVAAGQAVSTMVLATRYGLYLSSLRSLSETIPAGLVTCAARCGIVNLGSALALARQIRAPAARADALTQLASMADADRETLVTEVIDAVREAVRTERSGHVVRPPLVRVAERLDESALPALAQVARNIQEPRLRFRVLTVAAEREPSLTADVLALADAEPEAQNRALALTLVLPRLSGAQRAEAAARAFTLTLGFERMRPNRTYAAEFALIDAMEQLVPYLEPEQLAQLTAVVGEMPSDSDRVRILGALARRATGASRDALVTRAEQAASTFNTHLSQDRARLPITPFLPLRAARRALRRSRYWAQSEWMADKLAAAAPYVDERLLPTYLDVARGIRAVQHRTRAFSALLPFVPSERREALAEEAWRSLKAWEPGNDVERGEWKDRAEDFAQWLSASSVEGAYRRARRIGDADQRARFIASMGVHLADADAGAALEAAAQIADPGTRSEKIVALAERLPPEFIPRALAIARKLPDGWQTAALIALVPRVPPGRRESLVRDVWGRVQRAFKTGGVSDTFRQFMAVLDESMVHLIAETVIDGTSPVPQSSVLPFLAPRLGGYQLARCIASGHWAAIHEALPAALIPEALDLALRESVDGSSIPAVRALAPRLDQQQLQRVIAAAPSCRYRMHTIELLATAIPYLTEQGADTISDACSLLGTDRDEADVSLIKAIALWLGTSASPRRVEMLRTLLDRALAISAARVRCEALRQLSTSLTPELMADALTRTRAMDGQWAGGRIALVAGISGQQRRALIAEIMELLCQRDAVSIGNELSPLLAALDAEERLALAQQLIDQGKADSMSPQELVALSPDVASKVLLAAVSTESTFNNRGRMWEPLALGLQTAPSALVYPVLAAWLSRPDRDRVTLLQEAESLKPILAGIGGDGAASEIVQVVDEVSAWWP